MPLAAVHLTVEFLANPCTTSLVQFWTGRLVCLHRREVACAVKEHTTFRLRQTQGQRALRCREYRGHLPIAQPHQTLWQAEAFFVVQAYSWSAKTLTNLTGIANLPYVPALTVVD